MTLKKWLACAQNKQCKKSILNCVDNFICAQNSDRSSYSAGWNFIIYPSFVPYLASHRPVLLTRDVPLLICGRIGQEQRSWQIPTLNWLPQLPKSRPLIVLQVWTRAQPSPTLMSSEKLNLRKKRYFWD